MMSAYNPYTFCQPCRGIAASRHAFATEGVLAYRIAACQKQIRATPPIDGTTTEISSVRRYSGSGQAKFQILVRRSTPQGPGARRSRFPQPPRSATSPHQARCKAHPSPHHLQFSSHSNTRTLRYHISSFRRRSSLMSISNLHKRPLSPTDHCLLPVFCPSPLRLLVSSTSMIPQNKNLESTLHHMIERCPSDRLAPLP
jgi:hypothetical protein